MTFSDIFESNFLERVSSISFLDMSIALLLAFALGLFIMLVYKKTFKGVMYSHSFTVSLLAMCVITTLIILAVTSNIILSLGMVGALSIVRFRSAVKDPLDIAFLFWAISGGIVLGAGLIPLAIVGSAIIGIMFLVLMNLKIKSSPYILVLNSTSSQCEELVTKTLKTTTAHHVLKTKSVSSVNAAELTYELRLLGDSYNFVDQIQALDGVQNVVLVSYNGDYMG